MKASCRHRQAALDRGRVGEQVEHRAVRVDGVGQLAVARGRLRPERRDVEPDAGEARSHAVVEPEEAVQVEVALGGDLEPVELDAELGRPEAVRDRLAGRERRERVLDRVRVRVLARERLGLVDLDGVLARSRASRASGPLSAPSVRKTTRARPGSVAMACSLASIAAVIDMRANLSKLIGFKKLRPEPARRRRPPAPRGSRRSCAARGR